MKKSILIVDDHEAIVLGIKNLLSEHDRYHLIGTAQNGAEAVDFTRDNPPDIILMDISMPDMDGVEATRQIKQIAPQSAIIIYTMYSESKWVLDLFKLGISGFVLKDGPISDLLLALESVERGASYFAVVAPTVVADRLRKNEEQEEGAAGLNILTGREHQVFKLLADGKSVKSIADELFISPRTVETHKYNIMKKLKVDGQSDLTKLALKSGLIDY